MKKLDKKLTAGEVFEIDINGGFGYFQYVYTDDYYSACIRVLPGIYPVRPDDLRKLVEQEEIVTTFFVLSAALKKKLVRKVGIAPLSAHIEIPPLMRTGGLVFKDRVTSWYLWKGDNSNLTKIGTLTEEQKKLPSLGIVNDGAIKEMILGTWKFN